MGNQSASKLSEAALAYEESTEMERTLEHLRHVLGSHEYEHNALVKYLEGYFSAMRRIVRQADL